MLEQAGHKACTVSFASFRQPVASPEARGSFFSYPGECHCSPKEVTQVCTPSMGGANTGRQDLPELPMNWDSAVSWPASHSLHAHPQKSLPPMPQNVSLLLFPPSPYPTRPLCQPNLAEANLTH